VKKIIHARRILNGNNDLYAGTVCGRILLTKQTTADPRDATCKLCLKSGVSKQGKLELCRGCVDNFYNGNNDLGVKECWNLKKATIVKKKKVGMNDAPPWKHQLIVTILSCRHEKGYVFVDPEEET
jgi:hypothetical protein